MVLTVVLFMVPIITFVATNLYSKHKAKKEATDAKAGRGSKRGACKECGTATIFVEAWDDGAQQDVGCKNDDVRIAERMKILEA